MRISRRLITWLIWILLYFGGWLSLIWLRLILWLRRILRLRCSLLNLGCLLWRSFLRLICTLINVRIWLWLLRLLFWLFLRLIHFWCIIYRWLIRISSILGWLSFIFVAYIWGNLIRIIGLIISWLILFNWGCKIIALFIILCLFIFPSLILDFVFGQIWILFFITKGEIIIRIYIIR